MKKIFSLYFLLLIFSLGARAQNQYWGYQSYASYPYLQPASAVSVVHSDGFVYLFQADDNANISAAQIDPVSMLPTGTSNRIPLSPVLQTSIYGFYLEGAFEDFAHNFVLFGHIDFTPGFSTPFYTIIAPSLSTVSFYYDDVYHGSFIEGCVGKANGTEVYVFVTDFGSLFTADPSNHTNNFFIIPDNGEYYKDISYDSSMEHFIATGLYPQGYNTPTIILDYFKMSLSSTQLNPAVTHVNQHVIESPIMGWAEEPVMHVQLDADYLLLYRGIRKEDQDAIWLTRILDFRNANISIEDSWLYQFPLTKLWALDLIYDTINNRINFLGEFIYCSTDYPKILAQTDPFSLPGMRIRQLDGSMTTSTSCVSMTDPNTYLYSSLFNANRLVLNHHIVCAPVLVAGNNKQYGILTETSDIDKSDICDLPISISEGPNSPYLWPYTLYTTEVSGNSTPLFVNSQSDNIHEYTLCDDPNACSHLAKSSMEKNSPVSLNPQIAFINNQQFICHDFYGEVNYILYDLTGKTTCVGKTTNGQPTKLPNLNGLFFLQTSDNYGNIVVVKTLLIR